MRPSCETWSNRSKNLKLEGSIFEIDLTNGRFVHNKRISSFPLSSPLPFLILFLLSSVESRESCHFQEKGLKRQEVKKIPIRARASDENRERSMKMWREWAAMKRRGVETHGWLGVRTTIGNRMEKQE